jgi:hypothetical protein
VKEAFACVKVIDSTSPGLNVEPSGSWKSTTPKLANVSFDEPSMLKKSLPLSPALGPPGWTVALFVASVVVSANVVCGTHKIAATQATEAIRGKNGVLM